MHLGKLLSTVVFCFLFASNNGFACDKILDTGFCWPLDKQHTRVSTPFLEKGSDHGGTYTEGEYHIGVDIAAPEGSAVWPVADGTVISLSYGGWTNGSTSNYALLVRHTLSNGSNFIALYGHLIIPSKKWKNGDKVHINQPIGKVGDWRFGDHLHLSIWPQKVMFPVDHMVGTFGLIIQILMGNLIPSLSSKTTLPMLISPTTPNRKNSMLVS